MKLFLLLHSPVLSQASVARHRHRHHTHLEGSVRGAPAAEGWLGSRGPLYVRQWEEEKGGVVVTTSETVVCYSTY